jgi:hypothetical protein
MHQSSRIWLIFLFSINCVHLLVHVVDYNDNARPSHIKFCYDTAHARLCYVRLVGQNVAQRMLGSGKVAVCCLCLWHLYRHIIEH